MNVAHDRPLVLGHRGSPHESPENTLRSFAMAVDAGADGVELDVRPTRDSVPVVLHDDELGRTMDATGAVSALHWSAVERLTNARVPSFEQVAAWAAASGAFLNIEFKAPGVEAEVVRLLKAVGLSERIILSSFDPDILLTLESHAPDLRRFLLTERWDAASLERATRTGADGVCLGVEGATPEVLGDLDARGLPVIVWTANEPARIRALFEAKVAGVISDHPAMAARIRNELP